MTTTPTVTHPGGVPAMPIPASDVDLISYYPLPTATSVKDDKTSKLTWAVTLKDPAGSLSNNKEMNNWVTELKNADVNNTTCCIQMSHAINMMFHLRDPSNMVGSRSCRRDNKKIANAAAANKYFYYLMAVDEMKYFLEHTFEDGERISGNDDSKPIAYQDQVALLKGRTGIVVFMGRNKPAGVHTEIWTGNDFHQDKMKGFFKSLELSAPVWFWEVRLADPPPSS
jgi:Type VI secretion system (T6SS), amidase effector protein 4